jgi:hypothetical protein
MKKLPKDVLPRGDNEWNFGRGALLTSMSTFGFVAKHVLGLTGPATLRIWLADIPAILLAVAGVITSLQRLVRQWSFPEVFRVTRKDRPANIRVTLQVAFGNRRYIFSLHFF